MNLFKKYYPVIKKELINYNQGGRCKRAQSARLVSDDADFKSSESLIYKDKTVYFPGANDLQNILPAVNSVRVLQEKLAACKWRALIEKYLDSCDEEEKKFIDLLYFQGHHIIDVGILFPLSMRACQEWREEVLKNLVLLAAGEGLIDTAGDRQSNIYS